MGGYATDWESKLVPGEQVLWTGGPDQSGRMRAPQIASLIFGVPAILAGVLMLAGGGDPFLLMIGVAAGGFGTVALYAGFVQEPRKRRGMHYVLTNKRGFIVVESTHGGSLDWRDITADSYLRLDDGGNGPGSVWFHREHVNRTGEAGGRRTQFFGFEQISNAAKVHAMIQGIQQRLEKPRSREILQGLLDSGRK